MDEQGGKRRKSVEGKRQEIAEETEQDDEHASGPPRHRESLEVQCCVL